MVVLLLAFFLTVQSLPPAAAQSGADKVVAVKASSGVSHPLPFKTGETLVYDVGFSKLIFSGVIGELKLWVPRQEVREDGAPGNGLVELRGEAVSKGFFSKLFGIKVQDRFMSLVNPADFGSHSFTKTIEEGAVRREQRSVLDRATGRVTYTDRDLVDKSAKPTVKEAQSPPWIQDLLSAIYYMRTQKLMEGDVIPIPISDAGAVYNIEIVVLGKREEIKVGSGKFKTVLLDAKIFDGRYIRRSGEMKLWVSDDERHIPVKARIKTSGATITISLKKLQEEYAEVPKK